MTTSYKLNFKNNKYYFNLLKHDSSDAENAFFGSEMHFLKQNLSTSNTFLAIDSICLAFFLSIFFKNLKRNFLFIFLFIFFEIILFLYFFFKKNILMK